MNHICTWLCVDEKGEESLFPQTGQLSSSQAHQYIYWRCLILFFVTSKRFNKEERHVLFTNAKQLPVVDGRDVRRLLDDLGVEVIETPFRYKTPKGYFGMFQNQFYEFSILEYIAGQSGRGASPGLQDGPGAAPPDDLYLVLDSDCVFLRPVADLFREAAPKGFISFEDEVSPDYVINGLSRNDLGKIYRELLGRDIPDIPAYHLGEFLLCSVKNIRRIYSDFRTLWPLLLERYHAGLPKFNEEAHTLSYLYYKNGLKPSPRKAYMKRIWTNPLFYRNVESSDKDLAIWHLPAEKTFGIARLYQYFMREKGYGLSMDDDAYRDVVKKTMGIPVLPVGRRLGYYTRSCYRALAKRLGRLFVQRPPGLGRFATSTGQMRVAGPPKCIRIAALLASYNRKGKTLACLESLRSQQLPPGCAMDVFLTDDASQDGTAEAVKARFPEVHVLSGTGSLFWAGGMRHTWNEALRFPYDYYLLVNDDTLLSDQAVRVMTGLSTLTTPAQGQIPLEGIVIGATADGEGKLSYGGWKLEAKGRWSSHPVHSSDAYVDCDFGNANIMLVSRSVVDALGILSGVYTHALADYDYTLKAKKAGFPVRVAPGIMGNCVDDHGPNWMSAATRLVDRITYLRSPKGLAYKEYLHFIRNHFPRSYPSAFLKLWLKTLFPQLWDRFKHAN